MVSFKEALSFALKSLCRFSARIQTSYLVSWTYIESPLSPLLISFLTHFTVSLQNSICAVYLNPWAEIHQNMARGQMTRHIFSWVRLRNMKWGLSQHIVKLSLSIPTSRYLIVPGSSDWAKTTGISTWRSTFCLNAWRKTTKSNAKKNIYMYCMYLCWCPITDQLNDFEGFQRMKSGIG